MRLQIRKPEPASLPRQFKTQNTENPSIAGVLQAFRQGIVQRESLDEEDESLQMKSAPSLQTKSESSQAVGQVLQRFKNGIIQRESFDDEEELLQGKFSTIQREEWDEEEEPLQGKWNVAQRESLDEEEDILQGKFTHTDSSINGESESPLQKKENRTGLPDNLKSGVEALSGFSMDDVRVHYNSPKPAQLQALAYTQGTDIHVGPGQEKHLPHEAWHVVQQMQGRVQPTMQMQGVNVNDDTGLEREADEMGRSALRIAVNDNIHNRTDKKTLTRNEIVQKKITIGTKPLKNLKLVEVVNIKQKEILGILIADKKIYSYNNIEELKSAISEKKLVYLDKVVPDEPEIQVLEEKSQYIEQEPIPTQKKYAYIGTAIVFAGETGAENLAKKYVTESQSWDEIERKNRIATNFCFNDLCDFEANAGKEERVKSIATSSFENVNDLSTSYVVSCLWGYKYNKGSLEKCGTKTVGERLKDTNYLWYDSNKKVVLTKDKAKAEFIKKRTSKGVPYGALRSKNSEKINEIRKHLKEKNKTDTVYLHSIDADSPDFTTLKETDGTWKKVLEAYDETLESKKSDVVIGGYNLLLDDKAERDKYYKEDDYNHTLRSNIVDIAIRQAIHSIEPRMTYPTEPNLLIKASCYKKINDKSKSQQPWGPSAFEGRRLINNYITLRDPRTSKKPVSIEYDPLASISTGVGGGGDRLKIKTGKKYDENSIVARPNYDKTTDVGGEISIEDQYIVQAQSWAGASRVATSYRAAWEAIAKKPFPLETSKEKISKEKISKEKISKEKISKEETNEAFYPIENMVKNLLKNEEISYVEPDQKVPFFEEHINIYDILGAVNARLKQLQGDENFKNLLGHVEK